MTLYFALLERRASAVSEERTKIRVTLEYSTNTQPHHQRGLVFLENMKYSPSKPVVKGRDCQILRSAQSAVVGKSRGPR